eukprot:2573259-Amphidinium_carterae.1
MVLQVLHCLQGAEYISEGTIKGNVNALTMIATGKPVQTNTFIPTTADQDNGQHLWWMWLSRAQCNHILDNPRSQRGEGRQCAQTPSTSQLPKPLCELGNSHSMECANTTAHNLQCDRADLLFGVAIDNEQYFLDSQASTKYKTAVTQLHNNLASSDHNAGHAHSSSNFRRATWQDNGNMVAVLALTIRGTMKSLNCGLTTVWRHG